MILDVGRLRGRGSYISVEGAARGAPFRARIDVADDVATANRENMLVDAVLETMQGDVMRTLQIVLTDNLYGRYTVAVRGDGVDLQGTAKMHTEPGLCLLWSEDGDTHVTVCLFSKDDLRCVRGFVKTGKDTFTWELALARPKASADAANVVSLANRRGRRPR